MRGSSINAETIAELSFIGICVKKLRLGNTSLVVLPVVLPSLVSDIRISLDNMKLQEGAMLLYPLIKNQAVSHGRVAEILGIKKRDLIDFYSSMGIPYLDQSEDELLSDLSVLDSLL